MDRPARLSGSCLLARSRRARRADRRRCVTTTATGAATGTGPPIATSPPRWRRRALERLESLRKRLFDEIKGRVRETDVSAPIKWGDWEYFNRSIEGQEYGVHCRRPAGTTTPLDPDAAPGTPTGEHVVLDQNAVAGESSYYALRGFALSPNHRLLAYSSDFAGGELALLRVRDLATGSELSDEIEDVYFGLAWANDNQTLYYVRADASMRPWQVWRHTLGT